MTIAYRCDTGTVITNSSAANRTISFPGTKPSAGDLVIVGGAGSGMGTTAPGITDNNGNGSYTIDKFSAHGGNNGDTLLASHANVATGATFTLTITVGTACYTALGAIAFSGAATSTPLDVLTESTHASGSASSFSTDVSATTAQADEVAIAVFSLANTITVSTITASGYTIPIVSVNGAASAVGAMGYQILSATGTQQATFVMGVASGAGTVGYCTIIAAYKGAVGTNATGAISSVLESFTAVFSGSVSATGTISSQLGNATLSASGSGGVGGIFGMFGNLSIHRIGFGL